MSDLLITGSNAVKNSQLALNVVSNNIANVNTEGYVKQSLIYTESPASIVGAFPVGTGAIADGIKRAYDGLVESSVRNSESDLSAQLPLVDFTNRMIDVFGDQQASLVPALGDFFDGFRDLALDASSRVRRDQLLSSASTVTARFRELADRLSAFDLESKEALETKVEQFNELVAQLSLVNAKLIKVQDLSKQPPDLLDLKDNLLRDLSSYAKLVVKEESNGSVVVGLGSFDRKLLEKAEFGRLDIKTSSDRGSSIQLELSYDGQLKNISQLAGGEISGLNNFRERVLNPTVEGFDRLAYAFVTEMNNLHSQGLDLLGERGKELFSTQPVFSINYPDGSGRLEVSTQLNGLPAMGNAVIELVFDNVRGQWIGEDSTGKIIRSEGPTNTLTIDGVTLSISGQAFNGDRLTIKQSNNAAQSMSVAVSDLRNIAAADLFTVIPSGLNSGSAKASVAVTSQRPTSLVTSMIDLVKNNGNARAAITTNTSIGQALMRIPEGAEDTNLYIEQVDGLPSELQIFTKDGRHIFGKELTAAESALALTDVNGFELGATYSKQYLNTPPTEIRVPVKNLSKTNGGLSINGIVISAANPVPSAEDLVGLINAATANTEVVAEIEDSATLVLKNIPGKEANSIVLGNGINLGTVFVAGEAEGVLGSVMGVFKPETYLDLGWSAGSSGKSSVEVLSDGTSRLQQEARIVGSAIPNLVNATGGDLDVIAAGALNLNGFATTALVLGAGQTLTGQNVVTWLNANANASNVPVQARLVNEISVTTDQLSEINGNLQINGVQVNGAEPVGSLAELATLINNASAATGVESFVEADGSLLIRNRGAGNQGNPINFGAVGAIVGLTGQINPSVIVEYQRTNEGVTEQEVSLTLGSSGSFEDLSKLGFRGTVELTGKMKEELIVFATGADGTKAKIAAEYVEGEADDLPLFDRELELEFTSSETFEIRDRATNTVLAERAYDFSGQISYQGLAISISGSPVGGDVFSISANKGGIGGTGNLARMSQLEEADIFDGDQTLQQGYLSLLNKAGTISKQADVARQALEVLKDQAVENRESLAGVNLDEEAASLIRFQQSYQASARLVQTANELFETIVRL